MAAEKKDSKGNKVKFIRKNGKIIPIKAGGKGKDPSVKKRAKAQNNKRQKKYDKLGVLSKKDTKASKKHKKLKYQTDRVRVGSAVAGGLAGTIATKGRGGLFKIALGAAAGMGAGMTANKLSGRSGRRDKAKKKSQQTSVRHLRAVNKFHGYEQF